MGSSCHGNGVGCNTAKFKGKDASVGCNRLLKSAFSRSKSVDAGVLSVADSELDLVRRKDRAWTSNAGEGTVASNFNLNANVSVVLNVVEVKAFSTRAEADTLDLEDRASLRANLRANLGETRSQSNGCKGACGETLSSVDDYVGDFSIVSEDNVEDSSASCL